MSVRQPGIGTKRICPSNEDCYRFQYHFLIKKTPLKEDFYDYAQDVFKYLKIIPKIAIRPETWQKAHDLCKDVDEKDTPFLALSLELKLPLITRDKKLYNGLLEKDIQNVILFEEIFEKLQNPSF